MIEYSLQFSKQVLKEAINPGDCVVDCTAGNGHDTVFLAECVGESGQVLAFDIQKEALDNTLLRLKERELEKQVTLIKSSHAHLTEYTNKELAAVMFNLGYLPGGSHKVITKLENTLPAVDGGLGLLKKGGVMSLMLYPGHYGGRAETESLIRFAKMLPPKYYTALHYHFLNKSSNSPQLLLIQKK
ncbi:class I SAM-dependent methyltransferase [Proteinivorax hydrogeniformans]|uniref:Class I SAM-dependent methyltransferase n=1 Tax=Proteinivorax hydrogeniformans TaxID=1826727 RepID=A0AAU8HR41_9FIRM